MNKAFPEFCLVAVVMISTAVSCAPRQTHRKALAATPEPEPTTRPAPTIKPKPTTRPKLTNRPAPRTDPQATARLKTIAKSLKPSDIDKIRQLIEDRANLNATGPDGAPLLYAAAKKGYVEIVELLLKENAHVDVAHDTAHMYTPLLIASHEGHLDVVKLLLAAGADVTAARRKEGGTALYLASYMGHRDIVKLLLTTKADINVGTYNSNFTPLFIAALMGNVDVVKLLLAAKADVNAVTGIGQTALTIAKHQKHGEIIQLLVAAGEIDPKTQ